VGQLIRGCATHRGFGECVGDASPREFSRITGKVRNSGVCCRNPGTRRPGRST